MQNAVPLGIFTFAEFWDLLDGRIFRLFVKSCSLLEVNITFNLSKRGFFFFTKNVLSSRLFFKIAVGRGVGQKGVYILKFVLFGDIYLRVSRSLWVLLH